MLPLFNFRLNHVVVPMIFINRERDKGELTGKWQIAVWIDGVGRFTLDDESGLWERTIPHHVLEIRNEAEWEQLDPTVRQKDKNEGWQRVTPNELVEKLIETGVLRCI
ncbi:MAG: hypothetical protein WAU58_03235 [Terriglobales bacterium]